MQGIWVQSSNQTVPVLLHCIYSMPASVTGYDWLETCNNYSNYMDKAAYTLDTKQTMYVHSLTRWQCTGLESYTVIMRLFTKFQSVNCKPYTYTVTRDRELSSSITQSLLL